MLVSNTEQGGGGKGSGRGSVLHASIKHCGFGQLPLFDSIGARHTLDGPETVLSTSKEGMFSASQSAAQRNSVVLPRISRASSESTRVSE